jgi:outer membrane protein assembly factor BamB
MPSRRRVLAAVSGVATASLAGCNGPANIDRSRYSPGTDDGTGWPFPAFDPGASAYAEDAAAPRTDVTARWSVEATWPQGRPVVADDTLLYPERDALVALDAATGEERWRYTSGSDDSLQPTPAAIADGTAFVGTTTDGPGLVALALSDGSEQWTLETRGHVRAPVTLSPEGRWLFAGDGTGRVYQVDPGDGTVRHTRDVFAGVATLAYWRNLLVGTTGGEVYAFYDAGDRLQGLWRRKVGGKVTALAEREDTLAAATFGGPLYRLADGAHTGRSRWEFDRGTITLALAGDLVVGADGGGVIAVDGQEGTERWSVDGRYDAAPAVAGDTVYVGSEAGVEAYALETGPVDDRRRWRFRTESRVGTGLAVADGAVFALTTGAKSAPARVHALETP